MALTEKIRLAIESKGFHTLFTDHQEDWTQLANDARNLIKPLIQNEEPTVDDIKEVLHPLIELKDTYRAFLDAHPKLTQKYWSSYFTDYVLHCVYQPTLTIAEGEDGND
jgi:hypothetical protein